MQKEKPIDLQSTLSQTLYRADQPDVSNIKQVIESLKDRVQHLSPTQMRVIGYLEHLQSRSLHKAEKNKTYQYLIDMIQTDAHRVAPPSFFIRVIESLIPRPTYIDGKEAKNIATKYEGGESS